MAKGSLVRRLMQRLTFAYDPCPMVDPRSYYSMDLFINNYKHVPLPRFELGLPEPQSGVLTTRR